MNGQPVLIDGFCGAGGAAHGYQQAGFYVVGIDNRPQPNYVGDAFILADVFRVLGALALGADTAMVVEWGDVNRRLLKGAAAVHMSPVCKDHSRLKNATKREDGTEWQLGATRHFLQMIGKPWVIENVPGAPMRPDYKLCGCMFELRGLRRERWFETSWQGFSMRRPCQHIGETITVSGHGPQGREYRAGLRHTQEDRQAAMGIHWMNRDELAQAIPPVFTGYIGGHLLEHLRSQESSASQLYPCDCTGIPGGCDHEMSAP